MTPTREQLATLRELADDLDSIVEVVSTRDGDATARQHARANALRAALACLAAPPPAPDMNEAAEHFRKGWEAGHADALSTPPPAPPAPPADLVALREAEDATWAGAVSYVRDMAATVRAMAQKFVADSVMAELAEVRAEALDNCADGMERAAKKARAATPDRSDR